MPALVIGDVARRGSIVAELAVRLLPSRPEDAGEAVFAIARLAGRVAHALEEYEQRPLRYRARARYVGPPRYGRSA